MGYAPNPLVNRHIPIKYPVVPFVRHTHIVDGYPHFPYHNPYHWCFVFILNEDKFKLRSYSIYWPEGVAVFIPYCNKFRLYTMPINVLLIQYIGQRGGQLWSLMKNKFRLLCPSMYCLQRMAVWIHHEDELNEMSFQYIGRKGWVGFLVKIGWKTS